MRDGGRICIVLAVCERKVFVWSRKEIFDRDRNKGSMRY